MVSSSIIQSLKASFKMLVTGILLPFILTNSGMIHFFILPIFGSDDINETEHPTSILLFSLSKKIDEVAYTIIGESIREISFFRKYNGVKIFTEAKASIISM